MSTTNPYDDLLEEDATRLRAQQAATLMTAIDVKPDAFATQRNVAKYLGYPTAAVEATSAQSQREFTVKKVMDDASGYPELQRRYSTDEFAKLAHDDSGVLGLFSTLATSFKRGVPALRQNLSGTSLRAGANALEQLDAVESKLTAGQKRFTLEEDRLGAADMTPAQRATLRAQVQASIQGDASSIAARQAEKAALPAPTVVGQVMGAKTFGDAISAFLSDPVTFVASIGPESLVSNAPGLLAGALIPGGPALKATTVGLNSAAVDYGSQIIEGLQRAGIDVNDPAAVNAAARDPKLIAKIASEAIRHAGVVGIVDALSAGAASKLALPAKVLSKAPVARELANIATQTPLQGVLGGIGEAGGELAAGQQLDPGNILAEVAGEAFGTPAEVASIAGGRVRERIHQAREANAAATQLEQLAQIAQTSKLRQRAPEMFAEFANATADSEVFISAATLGQSIKPEQLAALPQDVRDQLPAALASGGDVVIKTGDFASLAADVPDLIEHARVGDPEAMTRAEAAQHQPDAQLGEEIDRLAPREIPTGPQHEAVAQARQAVLEQLQKANRFTAAANAQYADLVAAFVSTSADRFNLDAAGVQALVPRIVSQLDLDRPVLSQADEAARRGAYDPSTKTIALLQSADLSTFLHETGHHFLTVLAEQAARADAPAGVKADAQTLLDSFGVKDLATWHAMTLEQQRAAHEQFAEGFERYLAEGKAPSAELASAFAKFRAWLIAAYKKLTGIGAKLSPEVRAVMDRLLATDAQIADTQARRSLEPLFASAQAAGMTPEEFAKYQATGKQATEEAVASLQSASVRDLRIIANSKDRAQRKLSAEARAARAVIEAKVREEVMAQPIVAAYTDLVRGHTADGRPVRLSRVDVETNHTNVAGKLPQSMLANSERAMPAEMVAAAYGFDSADRFLKNLATMDKPEQIIEGLTDQAMLETYGEMSTEQGVEEAAFRAVANDARSRVLTTEANALAKATGKKPLIARAAREFAAASVAQRKVRDLRPSLHTAAEARAGRAAAEAFKAADVAKAAAAKREQLLQHVLASATVKARDEIARAVDYLSRFDLAGVRQSIDPAYLDQIDQLLESVDLRVSTTLKSIDKRKSLAEWVAAQEEAGFTPAIDERLLTDAKRTSYKEMTVEQVRGLVDTVKNIDHLGRLKNKLLTARDEKTFADVVARVAAGVIEHGGDVRPVELEGEKGVKYWLQGALASTRKIGSLAYRMDGAKDNGPVFDALVRPMNEAGTHEAKMIEQATVKLAELFAPIEALKGGTTGAKVFIPEINASLSRGGRLAVALNYGNEGNRQRLLDGSRWTEAQVQAILRTLSPAELHFVNEVHAYIDSFWPEIRAQQLRVSGVVEDKVEATLWVATASDGTEVAMRGGYYPAKYDTARSAKAEQHDAAQIAKDMLGGAYVRATTRRGFTKARAEEVVDRPLRLDLGVITQHVNEVVHNLAWQEWLIDANRLLRAKPVDAAVRSHYGPAVVRTLKDDLQGIAVGDTAVANAFETGMLWLRSNITRATLGASFTTALMQPFGLSNSIARIGAAPVLRGMARWGGDAARFESSMTFIAEKSDFMRLRSKQLNREISEISGRVSGKSKTAQTIDAALMFLTAKAQQLVDVPTWLGRYEQALAQGSDDATAVALADEAVLSSQGGGQTKDLAQVQRDHKLLTQFFSYFSTTANLIAAKTGATDFTSPKAVAGWVGDMTLLAVIPALGPAVLTSLLKGGGGDDHEGWAKFLVKQQAGYLLSMLPLVREMSGLVSGIPYSGPPLFRIFSDTAKLGQQVKRGEVDEPAVNAIARFFGDVTGAPMTQIMRSYHGWQAWAHGKAPATSILFGPPPHK